MPSPLEDYEAAKRMPDGEWRQHVVEQLDGLDRGQLEVLGRLENILIQTRETNGRVKKLELFRAGVIAVLGTATFATPFLLFLLGRLE